MIFPIGDDQVKGGCRPYFSYSFIVLNVVIFLFQTQMPEGREASFIHHFGSIPVEIMRGQDLFTLITSSFLHGSWMHLIGNMLFLWVFADNIEAAIGNFKFLIFYLSGAVIAEAVHIWFNWDSSIPTVGASGAISAVMGAYLVMFPYSRIKMLFLIFPFRISAWIFLGIWIVQQWLDGTENLASELNSGGVAWWAHIGGFAFGVISGFFFRATGFMSGVELEE